MTKPDNLSAVACYMRVSTDDQSHESQRLELQAWLDREGVTAAWYVDTVSGRVLQRPELSRLVADCRRGVVTTLIVQRLDRLSRDIRDGINLLGELVDLGVRVVAVTQQLDCSGLAGKLLPPLLFALAEWEWEVRRDRQRAGIEAAKKRGVYKGSKPGWRKADVSKARQLRDLGWSYRAIGKAMGVTAQTALSYCRGDKPFARLTENRSI